MKNQPKHQSKTSCFLVSFALLFASLHTFKCSAGGLTLITHGNGGDIEGWVSYMATRIDEYHSFPGSKASFYKLYFEHRTNGYHSTWQKLGGDNPLLSDSGEVVILLDWRQLANSSYSTYAVANAFVNRLRSSSFISELGGRAPVELPIHLIGHSRGGSLVMEMSRMLGTNGIWVDHLTTLDGYAITADAPMENTYENILFHDNYWQDFPVVVHGNPIVGAYNRFLSSLPGGYFFDTQNHSDVHLWYHGTIDWNTPASNSEASVSTLERMFWWTSYEQKGTNAGYVYSRIGGGDRMSPDKPAGPSSGSVQDGFNQRYELGLGSGANNRTNLPPVLDAWPNPIRFFLTGTNVVETNGNTTARLYYQWARPPGESAEVTVYLDNDANPWNGNEQLLLSQNVAGTTSGSVRQKDLVIALSGTVSGTHRLFVKITDGEKSRVLYAPELLTVSGSQQPLRLSIQESSATNVAITVTGTVGERFVLESSDWLETWQTRSTNTFINTYRTFQEPKLPFSRFYRARSLH